MTTSKVNGLKQDSRVLDAQATVWLRPQTPAVQPGALNIRTGTQLALKTLSATLP